MGSFLMGVLTAQLALGEPLWQRGLAYVGFGVLFGLLAALVVDPGLNVLTGHFVWVWLCAGVTALAIALPVGALARVLGQAGLPLAALAFLIVAIHPPARPRRPSSFPGSSGPSGHTFRPTPTPPHCWAGRTSAPTSCVRGSCSRPGCSFRRRSWRSWTERAEAVAHSRTTRAGACRRPRGPRAGCLEPLRRGGAHHGRHGATRRPSPRRANQRCP